MTALRFALITLLFCLTTLTLAKDDSPFKKPKDILKDLQKMADDDPAFAAKYATPEAVYATAVQAAKAKTSIDFVLCFLPGSWIDAASRVYKLKKGFAYETDVLAFETLDRDYQILEGMAKSTLLDDGIPEKVIGEKEAMRYSYVVEGKPGTDRQLFVKRGKLWFLAD